jgi:kynureninase
MEFENTLEFAQLLDKKDTLAQYRNKFIIPKHNDSNEVVYMCGNSLGLQPKSAMSYVEAEFEDWGKWGVEGHFLGRKPWFHYHKFLLDHSAEIVGAASHEVVVMNQLTVNLHLLLASFYKPTSNRFRIIMEAGAFPSDMYAIQTHVEWHGLDYNNCVIELTPREGEFTLRTEDILSKIDEYKDSTALVFLSGVQYYTGQCFDIKSIAKAAHDAGALAGFDLAHAAGNIPLELHKWEVDFAAWCSYKYLNSGPGNVSGVFIHEKHGLNPNTPRLAGWWGHKEDVRFLMKRGYIPEPGAAGWQLSNAPVFGMAVHLASLDIFQEAGIRNLQEKSATLTSFLRHVLNRALSSNTNLKFDIITPENQPGCQISLLTDANGKQLFDFLTSEGIIADWREPNVIRMAPVPLYNSFEDVWKIGRAFAAFKPNS